MKCLTPPCMPKPCTGCIWKTICNGQSSVQEFELHYQPIVDLATQHIEGFEALLRWRHPQQGLISPGEFVPVAEATGLIQPIGIWVLRQACQQLRHWQVQIPDAADLTISVNLSGKQLAQPTLVDDIDYILHEVGLDGRYLKLEVTESILIENTDSATGHPAEITCPRHSSLPR